MLLALSCSAALIATLIWNALHQPSLLDYDYSLPSAHASQIGIALPFAWTSAESGLLWSRARRRLKLGLADPEIVARYRLWTVATACFVVICALAIAAGEALAACRPALADAAQAMRGVLYLGVSVSIWRGMFSRASGGARHETPVAG